MSYQQFSNPPAAKTATSTTVVHTGQPAVVHAPQQPLYNPFAAKAEATKKLGITQLVIGIIVFIYGIVMIVIAPNYWSSDSGGGIWSGIFIIVAGSLCLAAGSSPDRYGTRCAALTFCIISLVFLSACGVMNFVGFATQLNCDDFCYYDYYYNRRVCDYDYCSITGALISLVLSILMLVMFVVTLIAAIFTGRGCCSPSGYTTGGYVVSRQPIMAPSGVVVSNYQSTATSTAYPNQPYPGAVGGYQQPGYQQPGPGYQPPASTYQPPVSAYQPPVSAYQPPASNYQQPIHGYQPQENPYPGQQHQYNQAVGGESNVTYGADYSQQKAGIPEGGLGEAPPPYNPDV